LSRFNEKIVDKIKISVKKTNDRRKCLMEQNDIFALRCKFLRTICTLRKNNEPRPVVYLDETWVNQNHSRSHIWQNEENTEGFKVSIGKGGRLIVCQAVLIRMMMKMIFNCKMYVFNYILRL